MFNRRKFMQAVSAATASATYLAGGVHAHSIAPPRKGAIETSAQSELLTDEGSDFAPKIKVIGVGGSGNLIVDSVAGECLTTDGLAGLELIRIDTDANALTDGIAHQFIQLGTDAREPVRTPQEARWAAEHTAQDIRAAIKGAHMLFIPVVLGGNTGTGAAPVIARLALEMGLLTVVGVVTPPLKRGDARSMTEADSSLAELEAIADTVIVMHYPTLLDALEGDATPHQVLAHANSMLTKFVCDTALAVNVPCHVGVDIEDVRTVLSQPGKAVIGTALAHGADRARIAAEQAMAGPLFEGVNLKNANSVLALVSAAQDSFQLSDTKSAMATIRRNISPEAHVIFGTTYDNELGDAIRVTVIAKALTHHDA